MLTFADQLASLLGVPQSPSLAVASHFESDSRESNIFDSFCIFDTRRAVETDFETHFDPPSQILLPSLLTRLLSDSTKLVEISKKVVIIAHSKNARIAEGEAEQAFFEPSMVGQVYFPDEHKVAVYVPLLGPMAVPLVMALIKEIRGFRKTKTKQL